MAFTIRCDECGKEQKLSSTQEHFWKNKIISLHANGTSIDFVEIGIYCICGNTAEEF